MRFQDVSGSISVICKAVPELSFGWTTILWCSSRDHYFPGIVPCRHSVPTLFPGRPKSNTVQCVCEQPVSFWIVWVLASLHHWVWRSPGRMPADTGVDTSCLWPFRTSIYNTTRLDTFSGCHWNRSIPFLNFVIQTLKTALAAAIGIHSLFL